MAAVAKPKEADDAARCRKHPKHRHSAGVCPFCLRDRLSRLSAEAASSPSPPSSSSSASSSPCSSSTTGEGRAQAPPCRRARLGTLMQQEQRETTTRTAAAAALGAGRDQEEKKTKSAAGATRRNGFWARVQQQLQHGCSLAHSKAVGEKTNAAAPAKRPPALV